MYKIGYRENNISAYADIVPEDQDEKMFGLSIVYERNDEIKEWKKYYWTSKKSPQYIYNGDFSLFHNEIKSVRVLEENNKIVLEDTIDFTGKNIAVISNSVNLGDNIAWLHVFNRFQQVHNCKVYYQTWESRWQKFLNRITDDVKSVDHFDGFLFDYQVKYEQDLSHNLHRSQNLYQRMQNFLNIEEYDPLPVKIKEIPEISETIPKPYICFSEFASVPNKNWMYENGWQLVIDYFVNKGYTMVNISHEVSNLKNCLNLTGSDRDLMHRLGTIKDSEFCIFLDTGLSWVANLIQKHCFIIKTVVSDEFSFQDNQTTIALSSDDYCRGCHDNVDYFWQETGTKCFTRKNYECSRLITTEMVINIIETKLIEGI